MRATRSQSALVMVAAVAMVVGVCVPAGAEPTEGNVGYVGANLAVAGLSLSDEGPLSLSDVAHDDALGASIGGGGSYEGEKKNPMVAFALSCLVPGWGEVYAGETTRGRWFMAAEAAIWGGYGAFVIQEDMRRDDYREYAQIFAGVSSDAPESYLSDIGDYIRSEGDRSYNQAVRSEARSLFPDDLEAQEDYFLRNGYFGDLSWDWGDMDRYIQYIELRRAASRSERNAFYMTGVALLNRALSAIDSAWMVRRHNAGDHAEPSARLSVSPEVDGGVVGARATLEVPF